jgi:hypothetical protein
LRQLRIPGGRGAGGPGAVRQFWIFFEDGWLTAHMPSIKIRDLTSLLCVGRAESSNPVIDFFLRQVPIVTAKSPEVIFFSTCSVSLWKKVF